MKDLRERVEEMLRFMPIRHESRVKWLMRCIVSEDVPVRQDLEMLIGLVVPMLSGSSTDLAHLPADMRARVCQARAIVLAYRPQETFK